jgi:hypothetical protein
MTAIGGKSYIKRLKPTQPQFVVQSAPNINLYLKIGAELAWVGDPNAATKFDSKYAAKCRVRELADVPDGRVFKELV